jgi:hypothetical protein
MVRDSESPEHLPTTFQVSTLIAIQLGATWYFDGVSVAEAVSPEVLLVKNQARSGRPGPPISVMSVLGSVLPFAAV